MPFSQLLKPKQNNTDQKLGTNTPEAYSAHPDTFMAKIDNAPASWGGGPEKVNAPGDLGTINPKLSSIKQPSRHSFEAR